MRKLAPAFVLTTIVALSSGSALALGDMNKNKNAPAATKPDVTAPADARTNGAATPKDVGPAGVSGNAATPPAVSSSGTMSNETVAVDKSRKGFNCEGIATTDPLYKTHNCGATKGGPGASGGDGGSAGAAGSSSSGSSR